MPTLYFVPGFGGSELNLIRRDASGRELSRRALWGGVGQLFSSDNWEMLTIPMPTTAQGLVEVGNICTQIESYADFLTWLRSAFPVEAKVNIRLWPYDFRLHAQGLGDALARQLVANKPPDGITWILAHSYGALVARNAWCSLVDQGRTDCLTRLTTFGGVLRGTHTAASAWAEYDNGVDMLSLVGMAAQLIPLAQSPRNWFSSPDNWRRVLLEVAVSWPGCYCMLPDYTGSDDPGDTQRQALLYDASQWVYAYVPPRQDLMDQAQGMWKRVSDPKYNFPSPALTCIVATGFPTPARVIPSQLASTGRVPAGTIAGAFTPSGIHARRRLLPQWMTTGEGDKRATKAQQHLDGHLTTELVGDHGILQDNPGVRANIIPMLTATAPPPVTPPPADLNPPGYQYLVDGSWLIDTPTRRPVGGSVGAPPRIVQLDP